MSIRLMTITIPALLIQGFLLNPTGASAENLRCPDSIVVQENVTKLPEGWFAHGDEVPHRLMRVGFFDGNPKERAELAPEKETRKRGKRYAVWRLDAATAKNVWISCSYGRTAMTLVQPVPKPYTKCTVVSDTAVTLDGQPSVVSIDCK